MKTRREFLTAAGAAYAVSALAKLPAGIRYGYTAMTWGKDEKQAIDDIATAGFEGIQFRIDATTEFQPDELKSRLAAKKLSFVALSGGEVSIDAGARDEAIAKQAANAKFLKDSGGLYLQVLDQLKAYPRSVTAEECRKLGALLTEIGKRSADTGIPLVYHNHMNTISEHPENLDRVLEASDAKYVHLLLDTAHSTAGGGNPAEAIRKYRERLRLVHLKDVVDASMSAPGAKYPFQWVELGQGKVDLRAVFAALEEVKFRGWAVVELDRVPVAGRTPLESAMMNRRFLDGL